MASWSDKPLTGWRLSLLLVLLSPLWLLGSLLVLRDHIQDYFRWRRTGR